MQTRTSIGGKDFIVNGSSDAVNTFIRVKVALEADGCSIVLPEKVNPYDREPDQMIEYWEIGRVFVTGSVGSSVLKVESPIETPVYA